SLQSQTPSLPQATPNSSFGNRFPTICGSNILNGSSQMANPPCVILTRRVSWNCSALDAKGIQRLYRCSQPPLEQGLTFLTRRRVLVCNLLRIALDSINTRFLYEQGSIR